MGKVLVTTLPKSGTHFANILFPALGYKRHFCDIDDITQGMIDPDAEVRRQHAERLVKIVEAMPDNAFIIDHVPFHSALIHWLIKRDVRVVTLVRNPYDFVVSLSHHLRKHPTERAPTDIGLHALQHWICRHQNEDAHGQLQQPMAKRYLKRFDGWVGDDRVFVLRFEDIIGPRGGGSFSRQIAVGAELCDFLGLDLDKAGIARAFARSFNRRVALFRKGQIGSWREEMAPNTADLIRQVFGPLMRSWGYSEDGDVIPHAGYRPCSLTELDAAAAGLIEEVAECREKIGHLRKRIARITHAKIPSDEDAYDLNAPEDEGVTAEGSAEAR
jgi:hypothetical protein